MQINGDHLETAIEIAIEENREGGTRWRNAVQRGADLLSTNRCLPISPTILLISSESGGHYVTDGEECRSTEGLCPAYANHRPCKHRAAHRLLQLLRAGDRATAADQPLAA